MPFFKQGHFSLFWDSFSYDFELFKRSHELINKLVLEVACMDTIDHYRIAVSIIYVVVVIHRKHAVLNTNIL